MKLQGPAAGVLEDAAVRLLPFLGHYSSAWCTRTLFSTLHHTSLSVEREYARVPKWFRSEPWPTPNADYFETRILRWCPACLAQAYHSIAHQLVGLTHCPLDEEPLQEGCPHCMVPLPLQAPAARSLHTVPFRSCPHCRDPVLDLSRCVRWPKQSWFRLLESACLRPLFEWTRRAAALHRRVLLLTQDAPIGLPVVEPALASRIAIEAWLPLPARIRTDSPADLRTVCVWIQTSCAGEVSENEVHAVFRSLCRHLAKRPAPPQWALDWRTGQLVRPPPRTMGDSHYFALWKLVHERPHHCPVVARSVNEVCTPCVLKLWAHRWLHDFDLYASKDVYEKPPANRAYVMSTFLSSSRGGLHLPLGNAPGLVVETYCAKRTLSNTVASPAHGLLVAATHPEGEAPSVQDQPHL